MWSGKVGMDCVNIQMYESSRERGEEKGNSADLQQYCGCGLAVRRLSPLFTDNCGEAVRSR